MGDIEPPKRPLLGREIIEPAIVWGGTGGFFWAAIDLAFHGHTTAPRVLLVGALSFIIAAGVLLLREHYIEK